MGKVIIHKSIFGHVKINGEQIDDNIKELEIEKGTYDIVAGTDTDFTYNTESYGKGNQSKYDIIWGLHTNVEIDEKRTCHIYVKRKLSLIRIVPIIKVKYK